MFDPAVMVCSTRQLCDRIAATHARVREAECEELVLAAAWADAHDVDAAAGDYRPLVERACGWGGGGCPPVSEHCVHELGALRGTGAVAARLLIADALDVRHRLPRLWTLVSSGVVRAWQARQVAQATHDLSWEQAVALDSALSAHLPLLAWPRFVRLLNAAVLDADPQARREREARARAERGVWSFEGEHGLRTLVARAASGDVRWFCATVDRIAALLGLEGDTDPVDARRAKAIGLLAQPAAALDLLTRHTGDPDPHGQDEPADAHPHLEGETETTQTKPAQTRPGEAGPGEAEPGEAGTGEAGTGQTQLPGRSLDLIGAALSGRDLRAARPRVVLHLHLSDTALRDGDGLVRPEHGDPLTLAQVHDWLADTGCHVTVRPVVDPADTQPVDTYETPARVRDALLMRNPVDVFPYANATSRTMDLDHTVPYIPLDRGGPPAQTGIHNLGPLTRQHHRAVTLAGWRRRQPTPGVYLFRSPNGQVYLTTHHGTLTLGRTPFAHALWQTAAPARVELAA